MTDTGNVFMGLHAEAWLVIATWGLVGATIWMVCNASETARRQLRAYVMVDHIILKNKQPNPSRDLHDQWITCIFKNFGQVPATDIKYTVGIGVGLTNVPPIPDEKANSGRIGVLAPGHTWTGSWLLPIGERDLTTPVNALYVYGRFTYHDGFTRDRTTAFRYRRIGQEGWSHDGELEADQEGNEAT